MRAIATFPYPQLDKGERGAAAEAFGEIVRDPGRHRRTPLWFPA